MYYLIYKQFKGIIKINHQKNIQVGKKKIVHDKSEKWLSSETSDMLQ